MFAVSLEGSLSNLGGMGTASFAPIVHWPEVAILGVGRAEVQPVYRDGTLVPRSLLPLCLSYDHRVIDGADAARFLALARGRARAALLLALER